MRESVQDFIKVGKALILEQSKKQAIARENSRNSVGRQNQNSIFNQQNSIGLQKSELYQIQETAKHLKIARAELVSALACLQGFEGINKRELLLAASFTDGYIYMLQELMRQQKSTLNRESWNRGLVKGAVS